jgi:hypothetical protein
MKMYSSDRTSRQFSDRAYDRALDTANHDLLDHGCLLSCGFFFGGGGTDHHGTMSFEDFKKYIQQQQIYQQDQMMIG